MARKRIGVELEQKFHVGESVMCVAAHSRYNMMVGTISVATYHPLGSFPLCRVQFPSVEKDCLFVTDELRRVHDAGT